ncbi:MAG: rRNA adenine N-6-methyltransferase family protein [Parcubacteria group bacterium]
MDNRKKKNSHIFLKAFLKNPLRTGSVVQSSPQLTNKMVESIDFRGAKHIVELGPGKGVITWKILSKMEKDAILFCFEIEPSLAEYIRKTIKDPRLIVINDNAEKIGWYLQKYGLQKVDHIISSLPLASLPKKTSQSIVQCAYEYLRSDGQYVQFQYSLVSLKSFRKIFSVVSISFVFLNFPPAFVYVCVKT